MSKFVSDLNDEQILGEYLDALYVSKKLNFTRNQDIRKQHRGIDGVLTYREKEYRIDEKAQLHYLNKELPTFTFELSYKNKAGYLKEGWLFDTEKVTQYYFLITAIHLNKGLEKLSCVGDINHVKVTSVHRARLILLLKKLHLSEATLVEYDAHYRREATFGKNEIPQLNSKTEGVIYYTKQLEEQPMNLQLRLQFLIDSGVAKRID